MSCDEQALKFQLDDLWRVATALNGEPDQPITIADVEQLEDVVRALVGIAAARRRRLKIRSRIEGPRTVRAPHIAASVGSGLERYNNRPLEDPLSADPVEWARAFLSSGDYQDKVRTYLWFRNAMGVMNPDAVEPEDPFWDDCPEHPHGRPPRAL